MVETDTQQCRMVVKTSDKSDKSEGDELKLSNDVGAVVTSLRDAATFADKTFMVRDVVTNFRSSLSADPQ